MKTIILASNNKNKLNEITEKVKGIDIKIISQSEAGYDIEVEETGKTFEENAILKAEAIYKISNMPVIAEDSGLEIDYLNGEPGVYTKRYAGENATSQDKIEKVLRLLENVEESKRTARFKCVICYIDKEGKKHIFKGSCEGKITYEPYGTTGFAYDPIFLYNTKTFAQMTSNEKNEISHRGKAVSKLVEYLQKFSMRNDIINYLKEEIKNRTESKNNKFGIGVLYHIEAVVKNAEILANKNKADKEVCIISAWLHDIASITDYKLYEEHHIHGAKIASEILNEFEYDKDKIELVKKCILNHRGSIDNRRLSKEEQIIADADSISHFDNIPSLLYLAYKQKNMNIEEGRTFVKSKLDRSFKKLSDESKIFYKEKFENAMKIL